MSEKEKLIVSFISDCTSLFMGMPTATAGQIANKLIANKIEEKRNILV